MELELADTGVLEPVSRQRYADGNWSTVSAPVPAELALAVYVNKHELVTILCTPLKLNSLVVGFLYGEGIIQSLGDLAAMRVCVEESLADVLLSNQEFVPPTRRVLTSGCGGGATISAEIGSLPPVDSSLKLAPGQIISAMKQLQEGSELYRISGGLHASLLSDGEKPLTLAEDVGRHNTLDKIQGDCLFLGISTRDRLLVSTGRLSSEMVLKAARMGVPIVASRSSPTSRSLALAEKLGITLAGYVRGGHFNIYTHPSRIIGCPISA